MSNDLSTAAPESAAPLVSFGYADVTPEEKTAAVAGVFDRVAARYDMMNDLMSAGMHRWWKDRFVGLLRPRRGEQILDLAGGTGDIAFRIARSGATVTVADINPAMLEVGRSRAARRGLDDLEFVEANAEQLPFADRSFDAVTIAFGIRNVTDIPAALSEIHRVLRWGGRFYCLEFSNCEWPGFARAYDLYSMHLVPRIGAAVAGDRAAYQYLVESIRRFPPMPEFAAMIAAAGFGQVGFTPILGGAVAIHRGWKV
jgi:demethylmenaquinone methyltransferase/2-methoxy-6-polyprenyl-1,4-benzoquinol methylase